MFQKLTKYKLILVVKKVYLKIMKDNYLIEK